MSYNLKWLAVLKVFVELTDEQVQDYDVIKEAILNLFQLAPEAYRLKFRQLSKDPAETYLHFATRLNFPFQRFLFGHKALDDPEKNKRII